MRLAPGVSVLICATKVVRSSKKPAWSEMLEKELDIDAARSSVACSRPMGCLSG